jgi:hypothetical protein
VIVTGIAISTEESWDNGPITERLPVLDLWEDGVEPEEQGTEPGRAA